MAIRSSSTAANLAALFSLAAWSGFGGAGILTGDGLLGFAVGATFFVGCVPYLCQKDIDSWEPRK